MWKDDKGLVSKMNCDNKINQKIDDKINELRNIYKEDNDALEHIEQSVESIGYYCKTGQYTKAESYLNNLEAFLYDWCNGMSLRIEGNNKTTI